MDSRAFILPAIWAAVGACLLAQTSATATLGTLEGKVVSQAGAPLSKVILRLVYMGQPSGAVPRNSQNRPADLVSATDSTGKFIFDNVAQGRYLLWAERAGYVNQNLGARGPGKPGLAIDVFDGTHRGDLVITMTPQGLISGKVSDEDGDPVTRVTIHVSRVSYGANGKSLTYAGVTTVLPDSSFLVGDLAPGRYYLSATPNPDGRAGDPLERATATNSPPSYVLTYYPQAAEFTSATPIDVRAGLEIRGMDIRLLKSGHFQIRGHVTGAPQTATNSSPTTVNLIRIDGRDAEFRGGLSGVVSPRDASFVFRSVAPGSYALAAYTSPTDTRAPRAYGTVTVADHDIDDVEITLSAGIEVSGRVTLDGSDQASRPVRITLEPVNGLPFAQGGQTESDGSFHIYGLNTMAYRISLGPPNLLGPNSYIKTIRSGGAELTSRVIDLTSGVPGPLEILLSSKAAEVSGMVRNAKGDPVSNAVVALWKPADPQASYKESSRRVNTDQNGAFTLRNVPPGDYRVAAWEDLDPEDIVQSPDFLARFESAAAKVQLAESARVSVDLTAIDAEAAGAEIAKLP